MLLNLIACRYSAGKSQLRSKEKGIMACHTSVVLSLQMKWHSIFRVNVGGVFYTLHATIPHMMAASGCGSVAVTAAMMPGGLSYQGNA